ncbi:hypothetical protein NM688_g5624 [Phlebia brevispora]|uniref:Uncharacterized protein n=1 Tax=Phlebia brevispora TaxID=194682 RepID=A0ACC1SST2_9APHY|nr:hypothetical protein NM688_g5624 [Phlebia brevispora]
MMDTTTTTVKSSEMHVLEERINLLTDLSARVEKLRHAPAVLRLPSKSSLATNVLATPPATLLREGFEQLKDLSERLKSESTQNALKAAKDSEANDSTNLALGNKRRNLKRTRLPSPESPQPFRAFQPKSTSLSFPPQADPPLRKEALVKYIKEFNRKRTGSRLHVWCASSRPHDGELPSPLVIRFTIRDVVVVYLTLGFVAPDSTIIVEGATAFGPREKVELIIAIAWTTLTLVQKPPHSQSDYAVYQILSQQIAKLLQTQPRVAFQQIVVRTPLVC